MLMKYFKWNAKLFSIKYVSGPQLTFKLNLQQPTPPAAMYVVPYSIKCRNMNIRSHELL